MIHKGEKPVNTPSLHMTKNGKFNISDSTSAKGKDGNADYGNESTQSRDSSTAKSSCENESIARRLSGGERERR